MNAVVGTQGTDARGARRSRAPALALAISATALALGFLCYPFRAALPALVRGTLPDFLWAAAFAIALAAVTRSRGFVLAGFVIAEGLEIAQIHPRVAGTFDPFDLVAIAFGFAASVLVFRADAVRPRAG